MNSELLQKYQHLNELISLKTIGKSMLPLIEETDDIIVMCCHFSQIKAGDIVVFYENSNLICHRCIDIDITRSTFIERGDNCLLSSKLTEKSAKTIIGKVVGKVNSEKKMHDLSSLRFYALLNIIISKVSSFLSRGLVLGDGEMTSTKIGYLVHKILSLVVKKNYRF